jgi:hypothetical protein
MIKRPFNNEAELHNWIEQNIRRFLGEGIYLNGNFLIYTRRNKGAKPDGFFFNFQTSNWTIIETELLHHGVWPHIAEQITRFSIAAKNPETLRNLRDIFFNKIEQENSVEPISRHLNIPQIRLLKHIESIIETTTPKIAIFIDEINEDLEDLAESLNTPISIFKVQKFDVNGTIEYYSDDYDNQASFETTANEIIEENVLRPEIILDLNNAEIFYRRGKTKFFLTPNNERFLIKFSKQYDSGGYWFGITPSLLVQIHEQNLTHILLQIGQEGYIKLPVPILDTYIRTANVTKYQGTDEVQHYHIHIQRKPELTLISPIIANDISIEPYLIIQDI